jgi:hypothetical protein
VLFTLLGTGYFHEQENLWLHICNVNKLKQYFDIPCNITIVPEDHQDKYLPTSQE